MRKNIDPSLEGGVKDRLIMAGLRELLLHGANDFSLRRVAVAAEVSCAAPYRHFKDKEELIRAIVEHIKGDYELLSHSVSAIFGSGTASSVIELCVSGVRFWIAGGNYPAFLELGAVRAFDGPISCAVESYIEVSGRKSDSLVYSTLAIYYGTVSLIVSGAYSADRALDLMRERLLDVLDK